MENTGGFYINENEEGQRLDVFLSSKLQNISRSRIKKSIDAGDILTNGKKSKASQILKLGDFVELQTELLSYEEELCDIRPQNIELDIVHEDDELLVVYKPRGMVVHPAVGNTDSTLVNALLYHFGDNLSNINGKIRAGIVHRIDKNTSGLLIVAKTDFAHESLALQLKNHSIKREYTLICHGQITQETVIEEPLGRDEKNRLKYAVKPDGKYAYTTIEPIEIFDKYTYAKAVLKTGRTHQIRVHLRYINHPIIGDNVYSNYKETIHGQLLHAGTIGFMHPKSGEYLEFHYDEPDIFKRTLQKLRREGRI